ncbi:hypothetical protein XA68_15650 [Ophiocordyceps unilateralis]|uniref:RING-type E3 ubiquitin transferase n=1 Tax=Ophiocordyceps unilateralis TaxID=268505 RepID=A0A2A9P6F0_OPHUN|nr:hypothetical protein XA68_15650 [Ophiocordyceps unilateralis]
MFTQPLSSPPPGPPATTTTPVSVTRTSRLRGLSYLRNYTHNHLLSREGHHAAAVSLTLIDSIPDAATAATAFQRRIAEVIPEALPSADVDVSIDVPSPSPPQQSIAMPVVRAPDGAEAMPSIRFSAYYDPRSTRPSLSFVPVSRTLPSAGEVIRVGRYSERDGQAVNPSGNQPSAAPVGFKSKVVSRRHCEFWCEQGKWFIKDVKSSSGTFLNHIRLSPPSQESKAYPVNDGDIVQLGIDFKGGEEMIFRCVKMRLELNRGWQNKLNTFNVAAHKRLRTMASNSGASSLSSSNSQDCSICLNSIAPCQSLFVAPCSHTWHFKCVRSLLMSPQYPIFVCPNCRAGADLEADVDEPTEDWQQLDDEEQSKQASAPAEPAPATTPELADITVQDADAMDVTVNVDAPTPVRPTHLHAPSDPLPITGSASGAGRVSHLRENGSPPPGVTGEGPITPRNNAGPWVFDGSAGCRPADASVSEMASLAAATEMDTSDGQAAPSEGPSR